MQHSINNRPADSATLQLAKQLIERDSVSPKDKGCQTLLIERLKPLGFSIERLPFEDVDNFWATRGNTQPTLVFAGHTDVVPTGDPTAWTSPPFTPTEREGYLFGRGVADMKGALAAMITACERFIKNHPHHAGSIGFLITSDEEAKANHGTVKVIEHLMKRGTQFEYCVIGEPTSVKELGDTIKNGRRGSLHGHLTIIGKQGHIAYPDKATNPIHKAAGALADLAALEWDKGNAFFPPTSFQISNLQSGTGATNVIPATLECQFNFRFSSESTPEDLQAKVEKVLQTHQLEYQIDWHLSGKPFLTTPGTLIEAVQSTIKDILGVEAKLSTTGGTSDGRFIATTGAEVIEFGLCNHNVHAIDESTLLEDLSRLSQTYEGILKRILC